jgi:hypothetical protein
MIMFDKNVPNLCTWTLVPARWPALLPGLCGVDVMDMRTSPPGAGHRLLT